jgi:hypothetical protein
MTRISKLKIREPSQMLEPSEKYNNILFEEVYLKTNGLWICDRNEVAGKKIKELLLPV